MAQSLSEALGEILLTLSEKHYCLKKKCVNIWDEQAKLGESAIDP